MQRAEDGEVCEEMMLGERERVQEIILDINIAKALARVVAQATGTGNFQGTEYITLGTLQYY